MRVMSDVTDSVRRMHTMTKRQGKGELVDLKAVRELIAGQSGEFVTLCRGGVG